MKKCLYLSVFFIAFFSSCSDNEFEEMSNSVPVSKYPQKVIDISMESPESFYILVIFLLLVLQNY